MVAIDIPANYGYEDAPVTLPPAIHEAIEVTPC